MKEEAHDRAVASRIAKFEAADRKYWARGDWCALGRGGMQPMPDPPPPPLPTPAPPLPITHFSFLSPTLHRCTQTNSYTS